MEPTKKMLILNILDILQKYTDENHTLSQKDILEILDREYEMKAERKAVRRNIQNLIDMGYEIEYSESIRMVPNPKTKELEENIITSDYYLVRFFNETDTHVDVSASVTEDAMFQFAKSYAPDVLVLGPERLVERLREDAENVYNAYVRGEIRNAEQKKMVPEILGRKCCRIR